VNPSIGKVRRQLTAWYIGVLVLILLVFGAAVLTVVNRQVQAGLDASLERTVYQRTQLVLMRGISTDFAQDPALYQRPVFVFDANGQPFSPKRGVEPEIQQFALTVLRDSVAKDTLNLNGRPWLVYGKRFRSDRGNTYATVAQAQLAEVPELYPSVFRGFVFSAIGALLLTLIGGVMLVRKSTTPIERTFEQMRRFMGDAAHELKTPVAVLRARADVALQRARTEPEYKDILTNISAEAERLGSLVENMLLLARVDAGQWPVAKEHVFVDDILLDAASAARALGAQKRVEVEVGALDEAPVQADPALLRQLFMILLDNAVSFTPEGGHVTASVQKNGRSCSVTIEDTGAGIPQAALPHIFDRFYRADPARGRAGAGLGLSIARWIVDEHQAEITVASKEGEGTTVKVQFPTV
jgi:signal transduction histidine kinase